MANWRTVSADPSPTSRTPALPCVACGSQNPKRPGLSVKLLDSEVTALSNLDLGDVKNPFGPVRDSAEYILCTACRDGRLGLVALYDGTRCDASCVGKALKAWISRCKKHEKTLQAPTKRECHICLSLSANLPRPCFQPDASSETDIERKPTVDWTLSCVVDSKSEVMRLTFCSELKRLSGCTDDVIDALLKNYTTKHLCYVHLNHCRYARRAARQEIEELTGEGKQACIFMGKGCTRSEEKCERLWRIPVYDVENLKELEEFSDLEETVHSHSQKRLHAIDVMGKHYCRSCLYLITEGKKCSEPIVGISDVNSVVDRWLIRCVVFALASEEDAETSPLYQRGRSIGISTIANQLRDSSIVSSTGCNDIRMIPFPAVVKLRKSLCTLAIATGLKAVFSIDDRTVEKRIESALSAKRIVLKKLGSKLRCYVSIPQIDMLLSSMVAKKAVQYYKHSWPSPMELVEFLEIVADQFKKKKEQYWEGKWALSEEVAAIPTSLWGFFMFLMAAERRVKCWSVAAKACGKQLDQVFPICNNRDVLPRPSIEAALNEGSDYSRADLLLCVRTLKVIEQVVMSRANSTSGPLTIVSSVSGICEVSPSFVSVLSSMGIFLSYSTTERYRQRLIAERERRGPWFNYDIGADSMPVLQFDNWDIKPLHAVKVDGKQMPKVNGSLMQGYVKSKRRGSEMNEGGGSEEGEVGRLERSVMPWNQAELCGGQ